MSFSSEIKEDLTRQRAKSPAQRASQLSGLTLTAASLSLGKGGPGVTYVTETPAVAKYIATLAASLYTLDTTIELTEQEKRKLPLYTTTLTGPAAETLLTDTGFLARSGEGLTLSDGIPPALVSGDEAARAFLRGAFLGSGSCVNPRRGYHVEFVMRSSALAEDLQGVISGQGLPARRFQRKDKCIVYLKGEDVGSLLALIGAGAGTLELESVRAEKEFRNYVNRKNNCDTANIGKTVDAALAQVQAINLIDEHRGLNKLPSPLYEAAMLRLNHPEATLQELADLAEIGKSGMNHRLIRLIRLAEEIEHG